MEDERRLVDTTSQGGSPSGLEGLGGRLRKVVDLIFRTALSFFGELAVGAGLDFFGERVSFKDLKLDQKGCWLSVPGVAVYDNETPSRH